MTEELPPEQQRTDQYEFVDPTTVEAPSTAEPASPKRKSKWRWVIRFISFLCFLGLVPLLGFAGGRIFHFESTTPMVLLESITPYVLLPAWLVLIFSAIARRWFIGALSLFLVVCHVAWVLPEYRPATSLPAAAATAPSFKLFSQNIKYDNETPAAVATTIKESNADVVMLQELTQRAVRLLTEEGAFAAYPYSTLEPNRGPQGLGIWSKTPFDTQQLVRSFGFPAIRVTTTISGHPIAMWNIHTQSPPLDDGSVAGWEDDLNKVRDRLHGETGDVIAAGDFNSTYSHRPFRNILSNGWRDVHIDRGRGYARTWPNDRWGMADYGGAIRIDHVLTHGNLRGKSIKEEPALGSDHRGLSAEIALL